MRLRLETCYKQRSRTSGLENTQLGTHNRNFETKTRYILKFWPFLMVFWQVSATLASQISRKQSKTWFNLAVYQVLDCSLQIWEVRVAETHQNTVKKGQIFKKYLIFVSKFLLCVPSWVFSSPEVLDLGF